MIEERKTAPPEMRQPSTTDSSAATFALRSVDDLLI